MCESRQKKGRGCTHQVGVLGDTPTHRWAQCDNARSDREKRRYGELGRTRMVSMSFMCLGYDERAWWARWIVKTEMKRGAWNECMPSPALLSIVAQCTSILHPTTQKACSQPRTHLCPESCKRQSQPLSTIRTHDPITSRPFFINTQCCTWNCIWGKGIAGGLVFLLHLSLT